MWAVLRVGICCQPPGKHGNSLECFNPEHVTERSANMAAKSIPQILAGYFNEGEGKRSATDFLKELKALSDAEKRELAEGVCAITGDTIK